MRSPIRYFGGKGNMVKKILPYFTLHRTYVEPFGGGASVLFAKEPSPIEVYNDIDSNVVNFFRLIRDLEKFEKFRLLVSLTPYSREEYYFCKNTWKDCEDEIEGIRRWFVVVRMNFGGHHSWGYAITDSCRNMSSTCSKWLSMIDLLPQIYERLMRVQIEHDDFRKIFSRYDTKDTLFYCDPPYIPETRKSGKYKHEMTLEDHAELVEILLNLKGKVVLSGYAHPIYQPLEKANWQRIDIDTACHAAGRTRGTGILGKGAALKKQKRTESLWISPTNIMKDYKEGLLYGKI